MYERVTVLEEPLMGMKPASTPPAEPLVIVLPEMRVWSATNSSTAVLTGLWMKQSRTVLDEPRSDSP